VAIQMKATEQYFPVVLFIMLYWVVLTFKTMDEILKCDYSYKKAVEQFPFCGAVCCALLAADSSFEYVDC